MHSRTCPFARQRLYGRWAGGRPSRDIPARWGSPQSPRSAANARGRYSPQAPVGETATCRERRALCVRRLKCRSAQRLECSSYLGGEEQRLFPRGEVAAVFDLVEVDDVRVARLDPTARRPPDLARERREAEWDRRRR